MNVAFICLLTYRDDVLSSYRYACSCVSCNLLLACPKAKLDAVRQKYVPLHHHGDDRPGSLPHPELSGVPLATDLPRPFQAGADCAPRLTPHPESHDILTKLYAFHPNGGAMSHADPPEPLTALRFQQTALFALPCQASFPRNESRIQLEYS